MLKNKKFRHELKYWINYGEYTMLRQQLKPFMEIDKFTNDNRGYTISSLYFDNEHDSALYDKSFGLYKRHKFRIRVYNGSESVIKMERKSKYGNMCCKEAVSLSRREYDLLLDKDASFLLEKDHPLCRQLYIEMQVQGLAPKVIVEYDREAYTYPISDVRVTFDKDMRAGVLPLHLFDHNPLRVHAYNESLMIMEVKYNEFLSQHIQYLIQPYSHRQAAISKYLICREAGLKFFK
jgi:hypothetical protein